MLPHHSQRLVCSSVLVSFRRISSNATELVRRTPRQASCLAAPAPVRSSMYCVPRPPVPLRTTHLRLSFRAADEPLANEALVTALIKKSGGASADQMQVRVLVEKVDGDTKPKPQLMSLAAAIRTAIDLDHRDLIAVTLDQDIPVLRIDRLASLLYKQAKKGAKSTKKQIEKEFRFNAEIEENDLKRKTETIAQTLQKGTTCIVSIRCKDWMRNKQPDIIKITAKRVVDNLDGVAEVVNDIRVFGEGTRAQFRLRPAK